MMDITACEVLNEIDKNMISLCIEWSDSSFKVTVLSTSGAPLAGKMLITEVNSFAETFNKTPKEYLQETKSMLSGKDLDVNFFLQNMTFKWKRKMWNLGVINLNPISSVEYLADILQKLLVRFTALSKSMLQLEKNNEDLKSNQIKLNNKLEDMINMKNTIEKELYEKFLVILNTKKKKIRELESDLKNKTDVKQSIYDICTDDSEMSDDDKIPDGCSVSNDSLVKSKFGNTKRAQSKRQNIVKDDIAFESDHTNGKKHLGIKKSTVFSSKNLISEKQIQSIKKKLKKKVGTKDSQLSSNNKERTSSIETKCREESSFEFTTEECIPHVTSIKDKDVAINNEMDEWYSIKASTSKCSNKQNSWNQLLAHETFTSHTNKSKTEIEIKETIQRSEIDVNQLNLKNDESKEDLFLEY